VIDAESAELLTWCVSPIGSAVVVALYGEMDMSNAPMLSEALRDVLDTRPARVTVDLTNLSYLDSSGIHCLVNAVERASEVGCELAVHNPTRMVLRVLELTDVVELLLRQSSESAATSH
jgi:anti-sigma B factor antagonist